MTTTRRAAQLLHRAADAIETEGWQQGKTGNPTDGWCTLGAIHRAHALSLMTDGILTTEALTALGEAIDALGEAIDDNIAVWNDTTARTAAEVTRALRRTADQLTRKDQPC